MLAGLRRLFLAGVAVAVLLAGMAVAVLVLVWNVRVEFLPDGSRYVGQYRDGQYHG